MARVECPECGVRVLVKDDLPAGRKVRCPKCEVVFQPFEEDEPRAERAPVRSAAPGRKDRDEEEGRDGQDADRPRRRPAPKGKSPVYWILLAFAGLAAAGAIAFLVFTLMGPSKMNLDTTFDLDNTKSSMLYTFDPISAEQTIKISVTPSSGKVRLSVYTTKGKLPGGEIDVTQLGRPLLRQTGIADTATLEGKIPADHSTIVRVDRDAGTPQVKLRVTN